MATKTTKRTPRTEATIKRYITAIEKSHGIVSHAAKMLGITRDKFYKTMNRHPEIKEALFHAREEIIDIAENQLFTAVKTGDMFAVKYLLSTIGKQRGYTEKSEIDHTTKGEAINEVKVSIVYVNKPEDKNA